MDAHNAIAAAKLLAWYYVDPTADTTDWFFFIPDSESDQWRP